MADFRKWLYALTAGAMLSGFALPTYAQTQQPFICNANAGVPPIVRAEGYTELVGDFVLACTGGVPTARGAVVPAANITVFLSTNITSRLLRSSGFDEALLIVDEPNSPSNPTRPLLNCGAAGAPDTSVSGLGVCAIRSTGNPAQTYDGTPSTIVVDPDGDPGLQEITCTNTTPQKVNGADVNLNYFGCGRPNVFQGRTGVNQNVGQFNSIVFSGVPLDPPGSQTTRILRITNVRADAEFTGVSSTFTTSQIQMSVSISNNASLSINNPQQIVAFVQRGLQNISVSSRFDFVQCIGWALTDYPLAQTVTSGTPRADRSPSGMAIRFTEGFNDSWKTKGWEQMAANGTLVASALTYSNTNSFSYGVAAGLRQNVPGAIYHTESGFTSLSTQDTPVPNPPPTIGTNAVNTNSVLIHRLGADGTGIETAGIATQGTRLAVSFSNIPAGSSVAVPRVAYLLRSGANPPVITGVAVLVSGHNSNGAGGSIISNPAVNTWSTVGSGNLSIYEVLFSDAFALEDLYVPIAVTYTPNLAQNQPDPTVTAQVAGGFAPFYSPAPAPRSPQPDSAYPTPRFIPGQPPQDLYKINKCACNLLFPFVTNAAVGNTAFDTGIALANTSLDPGSAYGFTARPQQGAVHFWYYNTASGKSVADQCTNKANPGQCPGTTVVPAGSVLTYVMSRGSADWGLDNRAAGFTGYMIAQAEFQYCHAFAYISAQGAGPTDPGMSTGYLGLVLDKGFELQRTMQTLSDTLGH